MIRLIKNHSIQNSPFLGYVFLGLTYLFFVFFIETGILNYNISDYAFFILITSLLSQLINVGSNLSINYYLSKKINKNFAPFLIYSLIILIFVSIFFYLLNSAYNLNNILKNFEFNFILKISIIISLNKVINSIFLSLKEFKLYFFGSILKLICLVLLVNFNLDFENLFLFVELIGLICQLIILHVFLNFNYTIELVKFRNFINHGLKVFIGNFLYDLLFKIDLVLFFYLLSGKDLEDLSLSIILFEYFYQIIYIVRLSTFSDVTKEYEKFIETKSGMFLFLKLYLRKTLNNNLKIIYLYTIIFVFITFTLNQLSYISDLAFYNTFFLILGVIFSLIGHVFQTFYNQIGYPSLQSLYFALSIILVFLIYFMFISYFNIKMIVMGSFFSTFILGKLIVLLIYIHSKYEKNRV